KLVDFGNWQFPPGPGATLTFTISNKGIAGNLIVAIIYPPWLTGPAFSGPIPLHHSQPITVQFNPAGVGTYGKSRLIGDCRIMVQNTAGPDAASIFCSGTAYTATAGGGFQYIDTGVDISIVGYTGAGGAVAIPALINGKNVTSIGQKAFYGNGLITSVTIPASITDIGLGAFGSCPALTQINVAGGNTTYASSGGVLLDI